MSLSAFHVYRRMQLWIACTAGMDRNVYLGELRRAPCNNRPGGPFELAPPQRSSPRCNRPSPRGDDRQFVGRSRHWDRLGSSSAMWRIADVGGLDKSSGSFPYRRTHTLDPYAQIETMRISYRRAVTAPAATRLSAKLTTVVLNIVSIPTLGRYRSDLYQNHDEHSQRQRDHSFNKGERASAASTLGFQHGSHREPDKQPPNRPRPKLCLDDVRSEPFVIVNLTAGAHSFDVRIVAAMQRFT
jgi:hypothetical protein